MKNFKPQCSESPAAKHSGQCSSFPSIKSFIKERKRSRGANDLARCVCLNAMQDLYFLFLILSVSHPLQVVSRWYVVRDHVPKQPQDAAGKQKPQEQQRSVPLVIMILHIFSVVNPWCVCVCVLCSYSQITS